LAKQAGFDLEFQFAGQPLKPSKMYLLPSVSGMSAMSRRFWLELLQNIHSGATLYLSHDDCLLSPFTGPFGLTVESRQRRHESARFHVDTIPDAFELPAPIRLNLEPVQASVLGREEDGNPVFTSAKYGEGKIYFLALPLEASLARMPGVFHSHPDQQYWKIYHNFAETSLQQRIIRKNDPMVGLTEHMLDQIRCLVIAINYEPDSRHGSFDIEPGWKLESFWRGDGLTVDHHLQIDLPGNDAFVFVLTRQ
jgi:hypothetical protein